MEFYLRTLTKSLDLQKADLEPGACVASHWWFEDQKGLVTGATSGSGGGYASVETLLRVCDAMLWPFAVAAFQGGLEFRPHGGAPVQSALAALEGRGAFVSFVHVCHPSIHIQATAALDTATCENAERHCLQVVLHRLQSAIIPKK